MRYLHYILCATTMASMIAARVIHQFGAYTEGKRGPEAFDQGHLLGHLILPFGCLLISFWSAFALAAISIFRFFFDPKYGRKVLWEAPVLIALIATTAWFSLFNLQAGNHYFLDGFKVYVEKHADLPAIMRWSRGLMFRDGDVPEKDWPQFVTDLSPGSVNVWTHDGNCEVLLKYGGGFLHWGLTFRDRAGAFTDNAGRLIRRIDDLSYVWVDND